MHTNKTAVSELMRISWRAVGTVIERVAAEGLSGRDMLAGLSRIGIDELQLGNGHSGHRGSVRTWTVHRSDPHLRP